MEIPASSDVPSCSCNSVSLTSPHCLLGSQYAPGRLLESDTLSPLPPSPLLPVFHCDPPAFFVPGGWRTLLWQRRFQGPLGPWKGFRHYSLILNIMPLVLPTCLLCCLLSLTHQPSFSACYKMVLFLCGVKKLENMCASSRRVLQDLP